MRAGMCASASVLSLVHAWMLMRTARFNVDLSKYPTLLRIEKELEGLDAFVKAHPSAQPDCPPEGVK
jgi:hypothetical protein